MSIHQPRSWPLSMWILTAVLIIQTTDPPMASASSPSVGQVAPNFDLPISGEEGSLALRDVLADGPAVVVVLRGYPGYQCRLCSFQLSELVRSARALRAKVAKVILVYPGAPNLLEEHALEFTPAKLPEPFVLVRDPGYTMVNAYGLRWDAPRETAYPSTFVIDSDGTIAWAKVSQGHGDRSDPAAILSALNSL